MSKALEALERIEYIADKLADWSGIDIAELEAELDEDFDYSNQFIQLREALTPPTADEVCEALEEHTGENVVYENNAFIGGYEFPYKLCSYGKLGLIINGFLPPHLVALIGRFYEGLKE